jgi:hypothetical protein
VKRQLSGAVAALVVLATGVLASACDVAPKAASANGSTISTYLLNTQLHALTTTTAGACLLQLESPQITAVAGQGAGGTGSFTQSLAGQVLDGEVGNLLAAQYASSVGITVAPSELPTAKSDFESTLSGEISAAVQQSTSLGSRLPCETAAGSAITGAQLVAALPAEVSAALIHNQAVDEKVLARGADLSDRAVAAYYAANQSLFTVDCVSRIVTATQAQANQIVAQLHVGASFADLAKSSSVDTQTASNGGSIGCTITQSQVEQGLQVQTVTVGQPIGPLRDSSSGEWIVYEVASQSVEPLSSTTSVIKRELLQASANLARVRKELVGFARHSDVFISPQYGTWKGLTIVAPVAPSPKYLLAAVSGVPTTTSGISAGG